MSEIRKVIKEARSRLFRLDGEYSETLDELIHKNFFEVCDELDTVDAELAKRDARIAELEAAQMAPCHGVGPDITGECDTICDVCGDEVIEGEHSLIECAKDLAAHRDRLVDAAMSHEGETFNREERERELTIAATRALAMLTKASLFSVFAEFDKELQETANQLGRIVDPDCDLWNPNRGEL